MSLSSALRSLVRPCQTVRLLSEVAHPTQPAPGPLCKHHVVSHPDKVNPIPGYDYARTVSFPAPGYKVTSKPVARTGVHAITGEIVKFPYWNNDRSCYDFDVVITDVVEVLPKTAEKGVLDIWLDGFVHPDLPKKDDEVYSLKGMKFGEEGPTPDTWRLIACEEGREAINEANKFWRKYGTPATEKLSDEQFEAMWMHKFNNPNLDRWELRRCINVLYKMDMIPEPYLAEQMLYACRRLDEFALAIRLLEGFKYKLKGEPLVFDWLMQELEPVMQELGLVTPDELNLHTLPESGKLYPY